MSILVLCKFTPLGFETWYSIPDPFGVERVNLPRWGLKLPPFSSINNGLVCKFTPLGFETFARS